MTPHAPYHRKALAERSHIKGRFGQFSCVLGFSFYFTKGCPNRVSNIAPRILRFIPNRLISGKPDDKNKYGKRFKSDEKKNRGQPGFVVAEQLGVPPSLARKWCRNVGAFSPQTVGRPRSFRTLLSFQTRRGLADDKPCDARMSLRTPCGNALGKQLFRML